MKTALMALVVLASASSFAAETYSVSKAYVVTSQYGVKAEDVMNCPSIQAFTVEQNAELKATKLTLKQMNHDIEVKVTGDSRTCYSDIVCPADDNFDLVSPEGFGSITRNNDDGYPTSDLPGYSALSTYTKAPTATGHVSCYYDIQKQ